jgi:hypothetical protein
MGGAIPPLPLHAFMTLTGKILRLPLSVYVLYYLFMYLIIYLIVYVFDYLFIYLFIRGVLADTVTGLFSVEW